MRKEIATKKTNEAIIERVTKTVEKLSKQYLELVDTKDYDEISRRFAMLRTPFIENCLKKTNLILENLEIAVSSATLVQKLRETMTQAVILLPEIGPSKCVSVRKDVADFLSATITLIKDNRIRCIKNNRSGKSVEKAELADFKNKYVSVNENKNTISEAYLHDEFIGELKKASDHAIEKTVCDSQINEFQ